MEILTKIRTFLTQQQADGLLITRRDNYTWITEGRCNHVMRDTASGVGTLAITRDTVELIADSSDCARLCEEENSLGASPLLLPWYGDKEALIRRHIGDRLFLSDDGTAATRNVQPELLALRLQRTEQEMAAYRQVGVQCAGVVESVCIDARPGQTENGIANMVCNRALADGIRPDCVLVGSDERIQRYRHPMPTNKPVKDSLMVVLGGEKRGLYVSVTRMVWFSSIPPEVRRKYEQLQRLFAAMQLGMRDGLAHREYFAAIQSWYAQAGYPDDWKLHHQGGPTGYACREFVVDPDSDGALHSNQVYAWNPSITGVKCEETTYLHAKGVDTLTDTGHWPRTAIETPGGRYDVADILRK